MEWLFVIGLAGFIGFGCLFSWIRLFRSNHELSSLQKKIRELENKVNKLENASQPEGQKTRYERAKVSVNQSSYSKNSETTTVVEDTSLSSTHVVKKAHAGSDISFSESSSPATIMTKTHTAHSMPEAKLNSTTHSQAKRKPKEMTPNKTISETNSQVKHPKESDPNISLQSEKNIGTRYMVWGGAIALILAVFYLVKYSIEKGFFTPGMRIIAGFILGLSMLVSAAWISKKATFNNKDRFVQALAGAGIASIYGTLYASVALYHFINPTLALILAIGLSYCSIVLAQRLGQAMAYMALGGALFAPLFCGWNDFNNKIITIYFILLLWASMDFMRRLLSQMDSKQLKLSHLLMPGLIFILIIIRFLLIIDQTQFNDLDYRFHQFLSLSVFALAFYYLRYLTSFFESHIQRFALSALCLGAFFILSLFSVSKLTNFDFFFQLIIALVAYILAWFSFSKFTYLPILAQIFLYINLDSLHKKLSSENWPSLAVFSYFLLCLSLPYIFFLLRNNRKFEALEHHLFYFERFRPICHIALMFISFILLKHFIPMYQIGNIPDLLLALLVLIPASFEIRAHRKLEFHNAMTYSNTVNTVKSLLPLMYIGLIIIIDIAAFADFTAKQTALFFTFQVFVLILAYIRFFDKWRTPKDQVDILEKQIFLASALASSFIFCLFLLPQIIFLCDHMLYSVLGLRLNLSKSFSISLKPWKYLILPALFFLSSLQILKQEKAFKTVIRDTLKPLSILTRNCFQYLAIILISAAGYLIIQSLIKESTSALAVQDILYKRVSFLSRSLITHFYFILALALLWYTKYKSTTQQDHQAFYHMGISLFCFALLRVLYFDFFLFNPAWANQEIHGITILNSLILPFLIPQAYFYIIHKACEKRWHSKAWQSRALSLLRIGFAFTWLTLNVRYIFSTSVRSHSSMNFQMNFKNISDLEFYSYSLLWILFGAALFFYGLYRNKLFVRQSALAILLLSVLKVFLIDSSKLDGLYRVASFFGLGVSLLFLSYLYTKFIQSAQKDNLTKSDL